MNKFITVEGIEGVGKSTNLEFIHQKLLAAGKQVTVTREPGGTELGEKLRAVLLDKTNTKMHEDTELLLMFAARAQHLQQVILPALAEGKWVLCDRFTDATYAYQGGGRQMDNQRIKTLETFVQKTLKPDYTFLLDAPVSTGMERAGKRGELDRFELEKEAFFERVRQAYLDQAKAEPERFQVIDAAQTLGNVQQQIAQNLDAIFNDSGVAE